MSKSDDKPQGNATLDFLRPPGSPTPQAPKGPQNASEGLVAPDPSPEGYTPEQVIQMMERILPLPRLLEAEAEALTILRGAITPDEEGVIQPVSSSTRWAVDRIRELARERCRLYIGPLGPRRPAVERPVGDTKVVYLEAHKRHQDLSLWRARIDVADEQISSAWSNGKISHSTKLALQADLDAIRRRVDTAELDRILQTIQQMEQGQPAGPRPGPDQPRPEPVGPEKIAEVMPVWGSAPSKARH